MDSYENTTLDLSPVSSYGAHRSWWIIFCYGAHRSWWFSSAIHSLKTSPVSSKQAW
jgi:hypothetical protein